MTSHSGTTAEEGKSCKTGSCGLHACSPCMIMKAMMIVAVLGFAAFHFFK